MRELEPEVAGPGRKEEESGWIFAARELEVGVSKSGGG